MIQEVLKPQQAYTKQELYEVARDALVQRLASHDQLIEVESSLSRQLTITRLSMGVLVGIAFILGGAVL